jgi:hypothetical protein
MHSSPIIGRRANDCGATWTEFASPDTIDA